MRLRALFRHLTAGHALRGVGSAKWHIKVRAVPQFYPRCNLIAVYLTVATRISAIGRTFLNASTCSSL
jgi:hypothetical protein